MTGPAPGPAPGPTAAATIAGDATEVVDGAFAAPYGAPTTGPPPSEVYEIVPEVAHGLGTDRTWAPRSTRWRFPT